MVVLIDFKTYVGTEKNSEMIGRMLVILALKTNKTAIIIAPKTITWAIQSIGWLEKTRLFLLSVPCRCKKIFVIIPSLQKQTP
jgi:hypothetical protein